MLIAKQESTKKDLIEMVDEEIKAEDCEKYVKQVHFASAIKNDGYIDKKKLMEENTKARKN